MAGVLFQRIKRKTKKMYKIIFQDGNELRGFETVEDAQLHLETWCEGIAGARIVRDFDAPENEEFTVNE